MTTPKPKVRVRVNVGRTSKGVPSFDATVEMEADDMLPGEVWRKVVDESDFLIAALDSRYKAEMDANR